VTQLEHALQTAALAEQAFALDSLVVAALLHDLGHLLNPPENTSRSSMDARHEDTAARWLSEYFSRAVTQPIRLHVAAKRYLCACEPAYAEALSPASRRSLVLQGGPMSDGERQTFEQDPWAREATMLRRWDDAAKVPGLRVPGLAHYRERLARQLVSRT
jgi:gamma-butyrobetaine dioxygenase